MIDDESWEPPNFGHGDEDLKDFIQIQVYLNIQNNLPAPAYHW